MPFPSLSLSVSFLSHCLQHCLSSLNNIVPLQNSIHSCLHRRHSSLWGSPLHTRVSLCYCVSILLAKAAALVLGERHLAQLNVFSSGHFPWTCFLSCFLLLFSTLSSRLKTSVHELFSSFWGTMLECFHPWTIALVLVLTGQTRSFSVFPEGHQHGVQTSFPTLHRKLPYLQVIHKPESYACKERRTEVLLNHSPDPACPCLPSCSNWGGVCEMLGYQCECVSALVLLTWHAISQNPSRQKQI